jgi:hypothetical protein
MSSKSVPYSQGALEVEVASLFQLFEGADAQSFGSNVTDKGAASDAGRRQANSVYGN